MSHSGENPEYPLPRIAPFCARSGKGMADRPPMLGPIVLRALNAPGWSRTPAGAHGDSFGRRSYANRVRRTHRSRAGGRGSVVFMHNPDLPRIDRDATEDLSRDEWVVCWNAFTSDASCAVTILDKDGNFHFMNGFGRELLGLAPNEAVEGRNQSEFLTGAAHEARMALIQRALRGEESLAVLGAIAGLFRRTVYRALDRSPGKERVLTVCVPLCQPVTIDDLMGHSQVYCETCLDLGPLSQLTERELQVLRLIGLGLSTHEIAERLHRSKKTIEWHRVSLGSKLNATNRVELARMAMRAGITWFDEDSISHVWRRAARANGNHRVQHAD